MSDDSIQEMAINFIENRNNENFTKLYKRLSIGLKNYIWKNSSSHFDYDTVEDILSRTFTKVLYNISSYDRTKAMFSTWIYRIARNEIIEEFRIQKNKILLSSMFSETDPEYDIAYLDNAIDKEKYTVEFNNIIDDMESLSKRKSVIILICWEIKNNLSPLYKDIIMDREMNNMKYRDLAVKYNLPINTIKSRIKIGRELIRSAIIDDVKKIRDEV